MGWTGINGSWKTPDAFFKYLCQYQFNSDNILDYAIKGGKQPWAGETEAYVAYKNDRGKVIGMVVLLDRQDEHFHGEREYLYKDISENEGPCANECPQRILDKLDAPESLWAWKWRKSCGDKREWPEPEPTEGERHLMSLDQEETEEKTVSPGPTM